MNINLHNVSKRYNYDWIFRNVELSFEEGKNYAITGPNGSGKSTLLKILAGALSPSEGQITFTENNKKLPVDTIYGYVSYAAPYLELIEAFTLDEMLAFHVRLKKLLAGIDIQAFKDILELSAHSGKQIRHFSSGMKQRLRLALAVLSQSKILLLDEPATNFDSASIQWYLQLMERYSDERIVVIGSNVQHEYAFCDNMIDILQYK